MNQYIEWINRAKSDFKFASVTIEEGMYYEDSCFHSQQAVEKAFKGLLIYHGVEPAFTHDIGYLLLEIEKLMEIDEPIKQSKYLTKYAVRTRYPGPYNDVSIEEHQKALIIAKNCLDWVEKKIEEVKKCQI